MGMISAKCTQCGANLIVDDNKEAGICEYCGTAFITEKAINNYNTYVTNNNDFSGANINIVGANIENLLIRAKRFEEQGDCEKAKEYYNRILDIDANHLEAQARYKKLCKVYIGEKAVDVDYFLKVEEIIKAGDKIGAIKVVREISGLSLKDAKDFVDNYKTMDLSKPQKLSSPQKNNSFAKKTPQSGGCYIATAVYGSYDCPEVWTLRRFRDYILTKNWYGRIFIRVYYTISPTLVKWFGNTEWFKNLWKPLLNDMVSKLNKKGIENTTYKDKQW